MGPEAAFLLIPLVIAIAVGVRLFAGVLNHERIKDYIKSEGGSVIEIRWSLFGPGWFASQSDVIYRVRYRDRDGNERHAYCKTGILSGVYLTEDKIVGVAKPQPQSNVSLEEENRRLREEIRHLKGNAE